jgi:glycosyltransferase involved in cell wall biosynthesis
MLIDSLSVVFPMFNEKDYIEQTIGKTLKVLKEVTDDYEIIIVDDASFDGSERLADELAQHNTCIKVAHHKKNRKLGGSLKTGFNLASKKYVLYSDMDMPFDLSEVKKAVKILLEQNADLVSAYRKNRRADGIKRYVYSIVYNVFVRIFLGLKIRDVNFSFKLMRTDFLRKLNLYSEGSFISAEMLIKTMRMKGKIVQFGTEYLSRKNSASRLSSIGVIFKILQESIAYRFGYLSSNNGKYDS